MSCLFGIGIVQWRAWKLAVPPGNRLEKLSGDRRGQRSIRMNQRCRVCFVWEGGDACEVMVTRCQGLLSVRILGVFPGEI
ncbi:MAG: type II toxin-antitoxin system RelE/ParE family toxin [Rubrobacter sp.]|nr:type II toxin-antitoxin system RelE/ParE family toxin [Rubrobacter sp.]